MLSGGCLCGGIRYEVSGPFVKPAYCHCTQCRKATGSAFAANASLAADGFRIVSGEALLARYESSPGQLRCFCSRCGSPLVKLYTDRPEARIRLGSLDDDPHLEMAGHVFTREKAPWYEIRDDLPRFDTLPPAR